MSQHASTAGAGVSDAGQLGRDSIEQRQAYRRMINANLAPALPYTAGDELRLLCECGRIDCSEWIPVELNVYRAVRRRPEWRLVSNQHEQRDADVVARRYRTFNVVQTAPDASGVGAVNGAVHLLD